MDADDKGHGTADNARPADAGCRVDETRRTAGEHFERVVVDIARMIGRQMAREHHAAWVAANDDGGDCRAGRDETEAE